MTLPSSATEPRSTRLRASSYVTTASLDVRLPPAVSPYSMRELRKTRPSVPRLPPRRVETSARMLDPWGTWCRRVPRPAREQHRPERTREQCEQGQSPVPRVDERHDRVAVAG